MTTATKQMIAAVALAVGLLIVGAIFVLLLTS